MPVKNNTKVEDSKGEAIRFLGKYTGYTGWYDKHRRSTSSANVCVIIDMGEEGLKRTSLKKFSIRPPHSSPNNREEAMIQQHFDIESLLASLCRKAAKCSIEGEEAVEIFLEIVKQELQRAVMDQTLLGSKADWKRVHFEQKPDAHMSTLSYS